MPCCMLYFDMSDTSVVNENRDLDDLLNISTLLTGRSAAKNRPSHCMAWNISQIIFSFQLTFAPISAIFWTSWCFHFMTLTSKNFFTYYLMRWCQSNPCKRAIWNDNIFVPQVALLGHVHYAYIFCEHFMSETKALSIIRAFEWHFSGKSGFALTENKNWIIFEEIWRL